MDSFPQCGCFRFLGSCWNQGTLSLSSERIFHVFFQRWGAARRRYIWAIACVPCRRLLEDVSLLGACCHAPPVAFPPATRPSGSVPCWALCFGALAPGVLWPARRCGADKSEVAPCTAAVSLLFVIMPLLLVRPRHDGVLVLSSFCSHLCQWQISRRGPLIALTWPPGHCLARSAILM